MDHGNPVIFAGDIAVFVCWAIMLTFVLRYMLFSPWRSERVGVALMGFMVTASAVLTFGMVLIITGPFRWTGEIRLFLFSMLAGASGKFLCILTDTQRKNAERGEPGMKLFDRVKGILRREPTLYIGVIAAILNWLVGFKFDWLTAEHASLWMVGINAILGAWASWKTRPVSPQAFTYLVASLAGLGAAYGLDYTQEQVGQFNAVVLSVLIFLTRGQVSPSPKTGKIAPGQNIGQAA